MLLFWAVVLGFGLRVFLALKTFGTNDVEYWQTFQATILQYGLIEVYERIHYFNHPPLMGAYLWKIASVTTPHPEWFSFLIRIPAVVADGFSTWLVYQIFKTYLNPQLAIWAAAHIALSPVLILVSGFHGNTDPVFMVLLILACYLAMKPRGAFFAGMAFGTSLSIKIVPVLTTPLFFFGLENWKKRILFAAGALVTIALGYGYHIYYAFPLISKNILQYSSTPGRFGLSQVLYPLGLWPGLFTQVLKWFLLAMIFWQMYRLKKDLSIKNSQYLFLGLGWTFLLFLDITPGFGIQYLAWFVAPSLFLNFSLGWKYNLFAGLIAFSAYNNWSDGTWWKAGSSEWNAWEWILLFVLWIYLCRWTVKQFKNTGVEAVSL